MLRFLIVCAAMLGVALALLDFAMFSGLASSFR
jgi:hypothetical protein